MNIDRFVEERATFYQKCEDGLSRAHARHHAREDMLWVTGNGLAHVGICLNIFQLLIVENT